MPNSAATRALATKTAKERLIIYRERLAECVTMLEGTKDHHDRQALLYTAGRWQQLIDGANQELGIC
jgi:hypothetical protein